MSSLPKTCEESQRLPHWETHLLTLGHVLCWGLSSSLGWMGIPGDEINGKTCPELVSLGGPEGPRLHGTGTLPPSRSQVSTETWGRWACKTFRNPRGQRNQGNQQLQQIKDFALQELEIIKQFERNRKPHRFTIFEVINKGTDAVSFKARAEQCEKRAGRFEK